MHVDLLSTTKGSPKIIHGTENGKKTGCGINLTKPENIGMFTNTGQMTDVVQITCEKCKTVIAKHLIRESNKELAAQLKEEQRQMKRERAASKHQSVAVPPPPAPSASSGNDGGYIPPSMRKATPPPPSPVKPSVPVAPPPAPAAHASDDAISQFAIPTVPTSLPNMAPPAPAPIPAPTPVAESVDDVLAQFAVPSVPSSLPSMAPPVPAPTPVAQPVDDVLAQFAVPSVPSSLPSMAPPVPAPTPVAQPVDDVLAQFAVPSVPSSLPSMASPVPAPTPVAQPADDVLAQFAVPSVPSSLPSMAPPVPAPTPAAQPVDDVLAQFAVPSVPSSLPSMAPPVPAPTPVAQPVDDVLAQFAVPSVPTLNTPSSVSGVNQDDILAQFSIKQPGNLPAINEDTIGIIPAAAPANTDTLEDLLLMPGDKPQSNEIDALPDIATVPTSIPSIPTMSVEPMQNAVPTLDVPQAPPAPPVPGMPVPPVAQEFTVPTTVQPVQSAPAQNQQYNPFAVPSATPVTRNTHMPLFVGYSADGRQLFQTYDENGNPIPMTETVYSVPPEQKDNNLAVKVAAMASNSVANGNAPIMELNEIMASMGIADPTKPKKEEGKAINFTEYKMPTEKKKKPASKPASAIAAPVPEGPISAAEAKRRKKVDKINKEFEKQLRSRGIDPKTGGFMIDPRK